MNVPPQDGFPSPEVLVVEASAGSGKTYALARRYVRLILHLTRLRRTPPIDSILAITFTNKAAFEMKARILRFLKELALGVMPEAAARDILEPIGMTPSEAKELAGRIMDVILRHYNHFQVQTIDKFINSLLVGAAFQAGLTANFHIRTDARPAMALALDALIEEASVDGRVKRAFDDFLTSMLFVESRSSWMPGQIVLDTVQELFREHDIHAQSFIRGGLTPRDLMKAKQEAVARIREFAGDMPEGLHGQLSTTVARFLEHERGGFRFKDLSASFQPGKALRVKKGALVTPAQADRWDSISRALVHAAGLEVEHVYDPYIELFTMVRERFDAACVHDDVVYLGQLNARAREVYARGLGIDELYYRLSTRFEHYLFDEFQDTSLLQWENLRALPEDAIANGGSLFYVGDKKQAIYTFRGGDTRLFDALAGQFADPGYHCHREHLGRNYRSHPALVAFNNKVFSLENLERFISTADARGERRVPAAACDVEELRRVYAGAGQTAARTAPEGCVRIEILQGGKKDDHRADARVRVLQVLEEAGTRFRWADIALLVRRNDDVQEVTRWLLEKGIPVSSERTLNIKEHLLVGEVVAFLRFLAAPEDDAAFAAFLLGDIFCAASGWQRAQAQDFVLAWRGQKHGRLYAAFREAFSDVWETFIEVFFKDAGVYPLYELTVSFYRRCGVLEKFPDAQAFLMHFLGLVQKKEEDFPGLTAFLAHYDELDSEELFVDMREGVDAVRVTTVHKAKGLEFPVVILPFLSLGLKGGSSAKKALAYTLRVQDGGLKLFHFTSAHIPYSQDAEALDHDEDMAAFFADLNNLYVALTRASCEIYGFIPLRVKNAHNLALDLIPQGYFSVGAPAAQYPPVPGQEEGVLQELAPLACRDWATFLHDEFLPKDELAAHRGVELHAILAGVRTLAPGEEHEKLAGEPVLLAALARPDIRRFFVPGAGEVLCEQELVDKAGCTRRVDRMIITPAEVVAVDFKLTRAAIPSGEAQVRDYLRLAREAWPGRRVSGFLVFLEEPGVLEVQP